MRGLPTGMVTLLFTDIEGSTRLLHELGDAYAEALAEHRRLLRGVFSAHAGVEVDTQGDAFFVAFGRATDALAAAEEAQQALSAGPVRVRMGLHTGEPQVTDEGYVGIDVHQAARICSTAHGGQVVLSERTRLALEPARTTALLDLGLHRLKDLGRPEKLFQLGDRTFPPLRSLNATNLPAQPSPLVGRERELEDVQRLLRDLRLVTLTGAGGSGKTRLGLQVAAELTEDFQDGVFWVPLAAVTDAELVLPAIAATIGGGDGPAEHIDEKRMLLLVDNLEQILDCAPALGELLESCPNLKLLATSRTVLRLSGEREYQVPPLPEHDAVALFRERALQVEPHEAVEEICRRLDGLPLAIELAAARTRTLTPDKLLERLERRLPLLTGGRRDAPERQRTLRATIAWSYDLLSPEDARLFARLAVFSGSFQLEAAERVCAADLDALEALLEQSLLRRTEEGRFFYLETIREFAVERLDGSDEAEAVRRRHAEHYLELAESANLSIEALGRAPQRHDLVLAEQHNLRAALDWAVETDVDLGLRLAVALENFWVTHDAAEGVRRFEGLLDRAEDVEPILRARALRDFAGSAQMSGDFERAQPLYEQALELFREAGDERGVTEMIFRLGTTALNAGDLELGRRLHEESLEGFRRLGDAVGELQALGNLGWLEFEEGNRELGWELTEQSLAMAREVGWVWWAGGRLLELAERSLEDGRATDGERYAREFLESARLTGDREGMVAGLGALAWAAAATGEHERAVTLWSAVEAEEARGPMARWDPYRDKYAAQIPAAPRPATALALEEAVEYALSDEPAPDEL